MPPLRFPVAVVIERVPLASRWASERWQVGAVERDDMPIPTTVRLSDDASATRWRFTGFGVELHRSEAEGYFLNITALEPKVFVMWRMLEPESIGADGLAARPALVTVSFNEAARLMDGGETVDALPLPPEIRAWMQPFVDANYKPEPKRKNRRNEFYEREDEHRVGGAPSDAATKAGR
ncbi:MAG TPA: DUF3305 domain-containing protein [Casimicrobiaceae bacterium]|nr:DUF3305 domain-containing protein [Casimicrobiaceae bacterium]